MRRYTAVRDRLDLCLKAEQEIGLTNTVFRHFSEGDFVAGDKNGKHLLYHLGRDGRWRLIEQEPKPIGYLETVELNAKQGRLL